jgi:hypothetical protein
VEWLKVKALSSSLSTTKKKFFLLTEEMRIKLLEMDVTKSSF